MKKLLTVLVTVVVLVIIAAGASNWFINKNAGPQEPSVGPTPSASPNPECTPVEVIAAPGTWESRVDDDPINPTANPNSYLLSITRPIQEQYPANQVKVWTLPYPAQFRNVNALKEMTYDESRNEGTRILENELKTTHEACPDTKFIIMGFSQGAVIAGDVAEHIGTNNGPVPAESVEGVTLIADGRRYPGYGAFVGNRITGVGAEVALQPLEMVAQAVVPGASMRGPRSGFGSLDVKVNDICAAGDTVCDTPANVTDAVFRANQLASPNPLHAQYATNPNVIPGTTATQWTIDWADGLINKVLGA